MKVVLINTVAQKGSTGKITSSLYKAIQKSGNEVRLVYGRGKCSEEVEAYKVGSKLDFLFHVIGEFITGMGGFYSTKKTKLLIRYLEQQKPDIIHLHNVHGFYLNCEVLFNYIKQNNIPVIWTLHDCWSFTGHCAYFDYVDCNKWKKKCYKCSQCRTTYPYSLLRDNTIKAFERKRKTFCNVQNMVVVTPCKWLEGKVKQSFLREYDVVVINNGINTQEFYREDIEKNTDKRVVLGVANIWEKRKGLKYFEKMLALLNDQYYGVLVGINWWQGIKLRLKFSKEKLRYIKKTNSIDDLRKLYNSADVYVNPTLEDNFPTTNLEAMACGVPVVAFDTGGCREEIEGTSGIIVEKKDVQGLVNAVKIIKNRSCDRRDNGISPKKVYDINDMIGEYLTLYNKMTVNSTSNKEASVEHRI